MGGGNWGVAESLLPGHFSVDEESGTKFENH